MAVRTERGEIGLTSQLRSAVERITDGADHVDVVDGGEPVAVVIPIEAYRRFTRRDEAARRELHETFTKISQAFADVPDEELEHELAKARAEYRAENRARREAKDDR